MPENFESYPSENKKGCLQEVDRLRNENGGRGVVYYVAYPVQLGYQVNHAYYLPDPSRDTDFALNQGDNGFGRYPRLTVGQVKEYGFPIPEKVSASELIGLIQKNW